MTDSAENDVAAYYCSTCRHPWGYHHEARGCTMPLDKVGLPVMRTDETVRSCACSVIPPDRSRDG